MHYNKEIQQQIKEGRSKFFAMATTYSLGVFNDNFFKQAAMLLAVAIRKSDMQGYIVVLLALPFVLFSAYTGWLADHYAKRKVVIWAKYLELLAMLFGAFGMVTLYWPAILCMVFLMGAQSALFSPSLNGSIPELYPEAYVTTANAIIKLVTTAAILFGVASAGIALDQTWTAMPVPFGRVLVAIIVIVVASIGIIAAYGVHKKAPSEKQRPFPWLGPLYSLKDVWEIRKDPPLLLAIIGSMFFYSVSSYLLSVINTLGIKQMSYSNTMTSLFLVSLMIGICIGSFIAAKTTTSHSWTKIIAPAAMGIGIGLIFAALIPIIFNVTIYKIHIPSFLSGDFAREHVSSFFTIDIHKIAFFLVFLVTGTFGGLFLIPLTSYIQIRPSADSKGKVIGAGNFCDFTGIIISGFLYKIIDTFVIATVNIAATGIFVVIVALLFYAATRKEKYHA